MDGWILMDDSEQNVFTFSYARFFFFFFFELLPQQHMYI